MADNREMNPKSESKVKSAQLVLESTLQHVELHEPFSVLPFSDNESIVWIYGLNNVLSSHWLHIVIKDEMRKAFSGNGR